MTKALLVFLLLASPAFAEEKARTILKAARVFDGSGDRLRTNTALAIEGEKILAVGPPADLVRRYPDARVVDLGSLTLLPGLIDAHTHILIEGDSAPGAYDNHLVKQSIPYRAIIGTANARTALLFGFTSIRDVDSEGAMYADADLAEAIERGVVIGPRMQVATRALAPTGGYLPFGFAWDVHVPSGAQTVDGPDEIRKAVREQVSHGATCIKVYADFGMYFTDRADRPLRGRPNFTMEEMKAVVDEAHTLGRKVAAHATSWDGIDQALRAGVDSIEHGDGLTDDLADRMVKQGAALVPTISALRFVAQHHKGPLMDRRAALHKAAVQRAVAKGVKIANGSDAGSYPWTENPAHEIEALVDYGLSPALALRAATQVAGALLERLCLPDQKPCSKNALGVLLPGAFADVIAVEGNPLEDVRVVQQVRFVMKGGVVYKGP